MNINEHNYDRAIRLVLAIVLFVAAAMTEQWLLAIPGVVLLATAVIGFCPMYTLIGFSTKGKSDSDA